MELLKLLEGIRMDIFTQVNLIFTKFGEEMAIFAILCLVYWCLNKKLGYQMAFAYLISGFVVNTIKIIAQVPRPFIKDTSLKPVEGALKHATGYSFPSGHTQAATSVYGSISIHLGRYNFGLSILLFIPIVCVIFSRMYLGVHTPYDVAVAFAITMLITAVTAYVFNNYWLDSNHYHIILIIVTFMGLALIVTGTLEMVLGDVPVDKGLDCFKIGSCIIGFIFGWYIEITSVKFNEKGIGIGGQILKYICGMIGLFIFYVGLKELLLLFLSENNLVISIIPYFFATFWVTGIYPVIIKKVFTSPLYYYGQS